MFPWYYPIHNLILFCQNHFFSVCHSVLFKWHLPNLLPLPHCLCLLHLSTCIHFVVLWLLTCSLPCFNLSLLAVSSWFNITVSFSLPEYLTWGTFLLFLCPVLFSSSNLVKLWSIQQHLKNNARIYCNGRSGERVSVRGTGGAVAPSLPIGRTEGGGGGAEVAGAGDELPPESVSCCCIYHSEILLFSQFFFLQVALFCICQVKIISAKFIP